jgi:hypothetical protein
MENINLKFMTKHEANALYDLEVKSHKQALHRIACFICRINIIKNKVEKAIKAKELDIGKATPLNYAKKVMSLRLAEAGCTKHFINNNLRYAGNPKALEVFAGKDDPTTLENIEKKNITNVVELVETLKSLSPPKKTSKKGAKVSTGKVKVSNSKELLAGISKQLVNLNAKDLKQLRNKIDNLLATTTVKDITPVKKVS